MGAYRFPFSLSNRAFLIMRSPQSSMPADWQSTRSRGSENRDRVPFLVQDRHVPEGRSPSSRKAILPTVHCAAGSEGEPNFGVTPLAAPKAASFSVSRYSRTARLAVSRLRSLFQSFLGSSGTCWPSAMCHPVHRQRRDMVYQIARAYDPGGTTVLVDQR